MKNRKELKSMNHLQREQRAIESRDSLLAVIDEHRRTAEPAPAKPMATATSINDPYTVEVEQDCSDCGGSGYDTGGHDPFGEMCTSCQGTGVERVPRNFLVEALRVAASQDANVILERRHIVAIVQYARQAVSVFASLPNAEVA